MSREIVEAALLLLGFVIVGLPHPSGNLASGNPPNEGSACDLLVVDESRARRFLPTNGSTPATPEPVTSPPIVVLRDAGATEPSIADLDFDGFLQLPLATPEVVLGLRAILHAHRALAQRMHPLLDQLNMLRAVIDSVTSGVTIADATHPDLPLIYINPAFEKMTGYSLKEVYGRNCRLLQGFGTDQPSLAALREAIRSRSANLSVLKNFRKDGTPFWNELYLSPLRDSQSRLTHFVGIQSDVTRRVEGERRLSYLARHDSLTGLVNRAALLEHLEQAIRRTSREHSCVALIFIDVNNFKQVNDVFGHAAGDALLCILADRLRVELHGDEIVARLGGDEFVIMIPNLMIPDPSDTGEIAALTRRIGGHIGEPVVIREQTFHPTASMGWSLYPRDGHDPEALLQAADLAMYADKHRRQTAESPGSILEQTPLLR